MKVRMNTALQAPQVPYFILLLPTCLAEPPPWLNPVLGLPSALCAAEWG